MKKYTAEEAKEIPMYRQGRYTLVNIELSTMKPGELITIEKGIDWTSKTPPYTLVSRFAKKHGRKFVCGRTKNKNGWNVKRVG